MKTYSLTDDSGTGETIEAVDMNSAMDIATDLWAKGDWARDASIRVRIAELNCDETETENVEMIEVDVQTAQT